MFAIYFSIFSSNYLIIVNCSVELVRYMMITGCKILESSHTFYDIFNLASSTEKPSNHGLPTTKEISSKPEITSAFEDSKPTDVTPNIAQNNDKTNTAVCKYLDCL